MGVERYLDKLEKIKQAGNYRFLRDMEFNGFLINADGNEMLNLCSNDYLGIASNPRMVQEFAQEVDVNSLAYSAASSRLLSGNHEQYAFLENDLATMYDREAALVFNSGYHANIGILPAVASKKDLIIADKLVHASIIDGMRLSEATMMRYHHADYDNLRALLTRHRDDYENVFIVSESIFSMDGDTADLLQLCEIKKEFDCFLYIDEAHAVGVRGTNGLGCCEESACIGEIDFIVGTFGKAFGSVGAYVICSEMFKEYLVNTQRSLIFTTGLPPINVAWSRFVLNKMPDFYELRLKLDTVANQLREVWTEKGFETRGDSHIVPMICGNNEYSIEMSNLFRDNGFFVLPVRYPTVPKHEARLRFSLNAAIPQEEYDCLFDLIRCIE
ncbi:MAG: aminotransferase class I/II-fold pyridoxal phosphate-dependent enzyme [Marinifilaceae bacterium]